MTLYIHTEPTEDSCLVHWAAATSSVGGIVEVKIGALQNDRKALAEIFVLNYLLELYPGKATCIETSHGALKKLLRGVPRFASTEMATLKVKYRCLEIYSHKKTSFKAMEALANVDKPSYLKKEWKGLGRPRVHSNIGYIEITSHAMDRFNEKICPSGNLRKLQKLVENDCYLCKENEKDGKKHSVYSIPSHGVRFVISSPNNGSSLSRMTTCYPI